jgi:hypothetical protein
VTSTIFELSQVADYFAKHPSDLALWVKRTKELKDKKFSVFDEVHCVKELENAFHMIAEKFMEGGGVRSMIFDARIPMEAPPLDRELPNPSRIDMESSKILGRLERLAMSRSLHPSPDSTTLFSLDAARLVFAMSRATIDIETKCFVDVSDQLILAELAAHLGFLQSFAIMELERNRISEHFEFVRPRLNQEQLKEHGVGFAFRDSACIEWPRNTQLLVLTVSNFENGMCNWKNMLQCIRKGTALKHLEVLAVIHKPEFRGPDLLGELKNLNPDWILKEELICSNSEKFSSERLLVKLFWHGAVVPRKDCLPTRSLQSDILISIMESNVRHGRSLRELLKKPPVQSPLLSDGHLYLQLEEWNHVSRILTRISPGMSVGEVLGSGGFGTVLSTTTFSETGVVESALKLSVTHLANYWNQSGWREFNFMESMKSNGEFLKAVECFSNVARARSAFAICPVDEHVVVSALNMERLAQTILPILENACLSYQNQKIEGLEILRNITRELIREMLNLNRLRECVHRDVKPQNIMTNYVSNMDRKTRLKVHLIDYGSVQKKCQTYQLHLKGLDRPSIRRGETKEVSFFSHTFPPSSGTAMLKAIGNGTPGYFRKSPSSEHEQYFRELYSSEHESENLSFEREVFLRDQNGLALTLLHAVIPKFEAEWFWETIAGKSPDTIIVWKLIAGKGPDNHESFVSVLKAMLTAKAPRTSLRHLESDSCSKLLELIFKLMFQPGFQWLHALMSSYVLDPIFSLAEESDLSNGIVIRGRAPGTDIELKPHILMTLPVMGLVVVQIYDYFDDVIFG